MNRFARSVSAVAVVFSLWMFAMVLINPGFFARVYASVYNYFIDSCVFCGEHDHGTLFCAERVVKRGAVGRWIIPSVGVNVACYKADDSAQAVTDEKDSAALINKPNITLLADHNYQGFDVIKKCEVGTVAFLDTGVDKQEFVCTEVLKGYNTGAELTDLEGNVVEYDSGYTNYTCHFFSDRITIVHFEPVFKQ